MIPDELETANRVEFLAKEIHSWSVKNFADQNGANHLIPAMGMMEEVGELAASIDALDFDGIADACADIFIYWMDFASRVPLDIHGITLEAIDLYRKDEMAFQTYRLDANLAALHIISTMGDLYHVVIKGHQGIRGFDDREKFFKTMNSTCSRLISLLMIITKALTNKDLIDLAYGVYQKIVSKRDFKTNPNLN